LLVSVSDNDLLRFLSGADERTPPRRPAARRRPAPVTVTYLPAARCPKCGYMLSKKVPDCCHPDA
jgi:hypothetical protein